MYANLEPTLSDNVHACDVTVAYGHPAMLLTLSPIAALFQRLGLGEVRELLVKLDLARLKEVQ